MDLGRWLREHQRLVDILVVVGLAALDIADAASMFEPRYWLGTTPLRASTVAVACAVPFWWRRRYPIAVLGVAMLSVFLVTDHVDYHGLASQRSGLTTVLAVYAVASWSERRRWATAALAALALLFVVPRVGHDLLEALRAAGVAVGLPWALGLATRSRRAELAEARRRVEAAEQERDEQSRRAVVEERAHIARELHDVVAHHVSLIGVQAGAARTTLDSDPDSAREALGQIEEASRRAVGEMRYLLDALRDGDSGSGTDPQPGLADLGGLLDGFRAAGLDVQVSGTVPAGLGAALDLTCFRLLEEALTNVTRHSAARRAEVRFTADGPWVQLDVEDPGPARPGQEGSGRGRLGMAERAALFGGGLHAGPTATGGWLVSARLRRDGEPSR